ncbi:MAG: CPBP family intramembrane metalloprotease [Gammaproteobacteria bacterium]|nr:CPBP family intramembrane metalloprotease [Gammaproteobacteria bacterium]MBV9695577.1 CPBP family intramembrane metalloprotease [Gammaproteobacteria bacterium]
MRTLGSFLALLLGALGVVAVGTYPAWLLLHPHFDFPFHRIGERLGMLALTAGFVLFARRLGLADRASLGYGLARRAFTRELALGLALGVLTMALVVATMVALGLLDWSPAAPRGGAALLGLLALRLLSGLVVAFIEETFLRGALQTGLTREVGVTAAVWVTALIYAATHFFAKYHIEAQAVTPGSGLALLGGALRLFATPGAIIDAFAALFTVGIALSLVRAATGNIAACIGLHAGWVWVMLVVHELAQPRRPAPLDFLLSRFDGFVGWLVCAWTLALLWPLWRFYRVRASRAGGR